MFRISKIWHGDIESDIGKGLLNCDPKAEPTFVVIKIVFDKHAGEVAAGRMFSGTFKQGDNVYMNLATDLFLLILHLDFMIWICSFKDSFLRPGVSYPILADI